MLILREKFRFFYDLYEGKMHSEVYEISATRDGGALVVFKSHNLLNKFFH